MSVKAETLEIVYYPNAVLRRKCEPVREFDEALSTVARRMIELMHHAGGVGLAAPQVGLSLRMFVVNPSGRPEDDLVCINPALMEPGEEIEIAEEGCLSIPDVRGEVRRPKSIRLQAQDLEGRPFTLSSDELPARIWQHETDHLDGILILDRMSALDKMANRRKLRELESRFG